MSELRVRYNPVLGGVLLAIGVLNALMGQSSHNTPGLLSGIVLCVLGVLFIVGTSVVVSPHEVEVRAPAQVIKRKHPIQGFADLRMVGDKLFRVSDGKKLVNMGWFSCRRAEIEALRSAVAATPAG